MRVILGAGNVSRVEAGGPSGPVSIASTTGARLQKRLAQRRSKAYMEAMGRLDAGTHHADRNRAEEIIQAVAAEFPELTIPQRPQGIVSRCYLGLPYVVHICDFAGNIIQHCEGYRALPVAFEGARALALHPAYAFVEVYESEFRAVSAEGEISIVKR